MRDCNLNKEWMLQSSAVVEADAIELSTPGFDTSGWYETDLPATVLGALVDSGEYGDPFFGENFLKIPGQGPKANNFSNHPMPEDSPFNVSWWYRKEFTVPEDACEHASLQFDGINYRANVWLNGEKVAGEEDIIGAYREFELDVTSRLRRGDKNVLAVEVFAPRQGDIAITWVDWNPSPPDKNMGIWRDVWLKTSGPVKIRAPHVTTELKGTGSAVLTIACDLVNVSDLKQQAAVLIEIDGHKLESGLELLPRETKRFEQTHEVKEPELWWPRMMGEPKLHPASLEVRLSGVVSDSSRFDFGIREVDSELTEDDHSLFKINGEPILIRGAGWATDLFLRRQPERDLAQLEYVKEMNLNTIRFEGMLERASFLEWCDREGILVIAGWCCCDAWEKWDEWTDEHLEIARESLRSQIRRSRRHPSLITWWYGSDFSPPEHVEKCYIDVLESECWPNARHSSAANKPTEHSGPSGLKMEGPYDYVPPNYWLEDKDRGGAFGFATEVCPGPAVPPLDSLKKMIPEENLWPIDEVWNFHAGGQEFHNINLFKEALINRYGECTDVAQFAALSQVMTYEAQRAMFEAYARNKFKATGVIQWMLNNAWPSLIWHLFDYYLRPAGGYFGTKKACEPLHVMYAYEDRSVVITNDYRQGFKDLRVEVTVLGTESQCLVSKEARTSVEGGSATKALELPYLDSVSPVYFIDLRLFNYEGDLVSNNFYWLPAKLDVLDYSKAFWIHTPIKTYANLQAIRELPKASLEFNPRVRVGDGKTRVEVEIKNVSDHLAFFTQLRLANGDGGDILPIDWSDNYISLLPGVSNKIVASVSNSSVDSGFELHISGFNVVSEVLTLGETGETVRERATAKTEK